MKLLSEANPGLFAQLDPEKNDASTLDRVTSSSSIAYWWLDEHGHSWRATVSARAKTGSGCPFCAGQKVLAGFNDLASHHPELAAQWHPEHNGELTAEQIHHGSNKKAWWICSEGHSWEAPVARRVRGARGEGGTGCPVCAGKTVLAGFNDLSTTHPEIAAQWHEDNELSATEVTAGSNKKVQWICSLGHSWETSPAQRTRKSGGNGCAVCSRRQVLAGFNDLGTTHPELAAQWHPTKNEITPQEVVSGSGMKVWWQCEEGHEWNAQLLSRTRGNGCPMCAGHTLTVGVNDLASQFPEVAAQWHATKNGELAASGIHAKSSKKFWWKCADEHEWEASIANRTRLGRGCPVCSNQRILPGINDLATLHPELVQEWDWDLNEVDPSQISVGGRDGVWWKCSKDRHGSWKATARWRVRGGGCPVCAHRVLLTGFNDMATISPGRAMLWHPTKNGDLDPTMITARTGLSKVWWKCPEGHEWHMSPNAVRNLDGVGKGCPQCSANSYSSGPEHEMAEHLRSLGLNVQQTVRSLVPRTEFDIYLPDYKLAIEFNGLFWHSEAFKVRDYHRTKLEKARSVDVRLLQIWEDEWHANKDLVLRMIEHKIGVSRQPRVYGRQTSRVEVLWPEAQEFLDSHHIQGAVRGSYYLGLRDKEGTLVALMVLRREANGEVLNILRYATSATVIGGFTKLMSWAESTYRPRKLITFSDNCISDGELYGSTGFVAEAELAPDYRYLVRGERKHKFNYQLKRFRDDPNLQWVEGATEVDLAILNKLHRIYDAGKVRWVKVVG